MANNNADYYQLLGVQRDADAATIKRAFRRKARELHPDVNQGDPDGEERFRQVAAAYEVLSDDQRRSIYDTYGEAGLKQRHYEPQSAAFGSISDIFNAFFGGEEAFATGGFGSMFGGAAGTARRGQAAASKGEDVLVSVDLDFRDAALGVEREVSFDAIAACETCNGSGAASDDAFESCGQCEGIGVVRTVARSLFGQVIQETTCPKCAGRGKIVTDPCGTCHGTGERTEERTVSIDIPGGIADGQRIRIAGGGSAGRHGAPPGNLYVDVSVAADERFVRDDDDLVSIAELTIAEAALGCKKQVPTVDGDDATIEFAAGTQPGEIVTLHGRGVGRLRGRGRGDQRVVVDLQVPRKLTSEQRAALQRFQEHDDPRNYKQPHRDLLSRLRRALHS